MVDIDHFKSINDNYGHLTGDEVLKGVAKTLRSSLRKEDFICRYGGEEFCIILPYVTVEDACKATNRFRMAIASKNFDGISITASFGVSISDFGAEGPQALVDQADKALYAAKNSGRNRVVHWGQLDQDHNITDQTSETSSHPVRSNARGTIINDSVDATPA